MSVCVAIPLRDRKGRTKAHTLVSSEDAARVLEAGPWALSSQRRVVKNHWVDGKSRTILLHRFVLEIGSRDLDSRDVHHKNHDPLDNRRGNLAVVERDEHYRIHIADRRRALRLYLATYEVAA